MPYYRLKPEVAGGLGDDTVLDTSTHPPRVERLSYRIQGWRGDDLLRSFPVLIASSRLCAQLQGSGLGSFELADANVTLEPEAEARLNHLGIAELLAFKWLRVTGTAGVDDIGVTEKASLVVSSRGLDALSQCRISYCRIEEFDPSSHL